VAADESDQLKRKDIEAASLLKLHALLLLRLTDLLLSFFFLTRFADTKLSYRLDNRAFGWLIHFSKVLLLSIWFF